MSYETLNAKVLELKDDMIASIQQNMRIESVRGESAPGAPYGEGPKAALDDVLALGEKLGFRTGQADNRVGWIEYGYYAVYESVYGVSIWTADRFKSKFKLMTLIE